MNPRGITNKKAHSISTAGLKGYFLVLELDQPFTKLLQASIILRRLVYTIHWVSRSSREMSTSVIWERWKISRKVSWTSSVSWIKKVSRMDCRARLSLKRRASRRRWLLDELDIIQNLKMWINSSCCPTHHPHRENSHRIGTGEAGAFL